jgi:hypothetical protein
MSFADKHLEETYKALMPLASGALKMALGLNGAAVVALLAFIRDAGPHPNVKEPIIIFVIGIVLAALGHIDAYISQLVLFEESKRRQAGRVVPLWLRHEWYLWGGVILVVLSVAGLLLGRCFRSGANSSIKLTARRRFRSSRPPAPASPAAASRACRRRG